MVVALMEPMGEVAPLPVVDWGRGFGKAAAKEARRIEASIVAMVRGWYKS